MSEENLFDEAESEQARWDVCRYLAALKRTRCNEYLGGLVEDLATKGEVRLMGEVTASPCGSRSATTYRTQWLAGRLGPIVPYVKWLDREVWVRNLTRVAMGGEVETIEGMQVWKAGLELVCDSLRQNGRSFGGVRLECVDWDGRLQYILGLVGEGCSSGRRMGIGFSSSCQVEQRLRFILGGALGELGLDLHPPSLAFTRVSDLSQ